MLSQREKLLSISRENLKILIAGVGGQGVLVASYVIGQLALNSGLKVRISEDIGQAQRGGPVVSHIRLGEGSYAPINTLHTVDLVIGFEPLEAYRNTIKFLRPMGEVVFNTEPVYLASNPRKEEVHYPPIEMMAAAIKKIARRILQLDAGDLAQKAGNSAAVNMVMLGAAIATGLPFTVGDTENLIKDTIPRDSAGNLRAFHYGFSEAKERIVT